MDLIQQTEDNDDEVEQNTPSMIDQLLVSNDKGYLNLEGKFDITIDAWRWQATIQLDSEFNDLTTGEEALLTESAGDRVFAMAGSGVIAFGEITHVQDHTDKIVVSCKTPGEPSEDE